MNCRLTASIKFHDVLHGFRVGCGTGTTALEAKMLQQLTTMREVVLFEGFLDLQKAYDALDQGRRLEIITAYGVGPRKIRLFWTYWDCLTMVARASRYFGLPFKGNRGVTQRDPLPSTVFNVVVDAVIRH